MPIRVQCGSCDFVGRVRDEMAGKLSRCPKCGAKLRVPGPPTPRKPDPEPVAEAEIDEADDQAPANPKNRGYCPECRTRLARDAVVCLDCGYDFRTGSRHKTKRVKAPKPRPEEPEEEEAPSRSRGDGEGGWGGIVWFVLIFGVGNAILYMTTGYVIIPIRR